MNPRVKSSAIALPILTVLMSLGSWGGKGAIGQAQPTPTPSPSSLPFPFSPNPSQSAPLSSPAFTPSIGDNPEPELGVLVNEVVIKGVDGKLQKEVYRVIKTQPQKTTTRAQLQEDIQAILATGYFYDVEVVGENTASGVLVTFKVRQSPILTSVKLADDSVFLPQSTIDENFRDQYGKSFRSNQFEKNIKKIIDQVFQNEGQALEIKEWKISLNGVVTLKLTRQKKFKVAEVIVNGVTGSLRDEV
jgi:outer membrane protein insertion porin family